jgi:hypothetical protein
MIPIGYMAKRVVQRPEFLKATLVVDIYSVSSCVNDDFTDYIDYWKHNGYWLFDSPQVIQTLARENSIDIKGTKLFYYEAHEVQFDGEHWRSFAPSWEDSVNVTLPSLSQLEGFDVVTFMAGNKPECSPLSCNSLAEEIQTNQHFLLESCAEAEAVLNTGRFTRCEPGPYRIFAVYSVDWPTA